MGGEGDPGAVVDAAGHVRQLTEGVLAGGGAEVEVQLVAQGLGHPQVVGGAVLAGAVVVVVQGARLRHIVDGDILQGVAGIALLEEAGDVVGVDLHPAAVAAVIADVAALRRRAGARVADLNGQGGIYLFPIYAVHGDVEDQHVLVGVAVSAEGEGLQLELIVVPDIPGAVIEYAVVQIAFIELVAPVILVVHYAVGLEPAVIVKVVVVGELDVRQLVIIGLVPEEVVKLLGIQRHVIIRVHLIDKVRLDGAGGALPVADLDVQGAVNPVAVFAPHGEIEGQSVLVRIAAGTECQGVQFKLVIASDIILFIIKLGIVQIAVVQFVIPDIVLVVVVAIGLEVSVVVKVVIVGEFQIVEVIPGLLVEQIREVVGIHGHIIAGVHIVGQLHVAAGALGAAFNVDADGRADISLVAVQLNCKIQRVAIDVLIRHKLQRIQIKVAVIIFVVVEEIII